VVENLNTQRSELHTTINLNDVEIRLKKERLSVIESEGGFGGLAVGMPEDDDERTLNRDADDDDDTAMNLSKRVPQPTSQIKHQFLKDDSMMIIGANQYRLT
jgi:hypothetical protein